MEEKKISLNNDAISAFIDEIRDRLTKQGLEEKNVTYLALSIEEYLLRWQDAFGSEREAAVSLTKRFGRPCITLELKGERYDPTAQSGDEPDLSSRLLSAMGLAPSFSYRRGANRLSLQIKKTKKSSLPLLIGIVLAVLTGLAGKYLFPAQTVEISEALLIPIRETLLGLLTAAAVPMIFFSVLVGICETGSAAEFGQIGNRLLWGFILRSFVLTALVSVLALPAFSLNFANSGFSPRQFSGTLQMILDIFPHNLFEPFATGNTLQVLVIAVAAGVALLFLGDSVEEVRTLAQKLYSVAELFLQWACRLIAPIFVIILLETIWTSDLGAFVNLWKPLLVVLAFAVLAILFSLLRNSVKYRISPLKLMKKILPATARAFITSSASAALGESLECSRHKLGIPRQISYFGLPAGAVMYKPLCAVYLFVCIFFCAEYYSIPCSLPWLLLGCISSTLIAAAIPPVPGGGMACYTILFSQMGIPSEAIAFAIAMDIIIDRFNAASNVTLLHLDLLNLANRQNLLDREILKR